MTKGKCFSGVNRGQRRKGDFYETPYSMTYQLLKAESFNGNVLEPACGKGAICKVLNKFSIRNKGFDISQGKDFLQYKGRVDNIITNPPFSLAKEFILKSKEVCKKKFAFLLPLSYLHGKERYDTIYNDRGFPLEWVYIFTRYPMLGDPLRRDGKYRTGMMVYAWFIWNKGYEGNNPKIDWLDNQKYILSKKDLV